MTTTIDIAEIARRSQSIKQPIETAKHLPGEMYASEEVYDLEVKNIFKKEWFIIGREEEIPNIGDYKVHKIFGQSILTCRDKSGKVQAFYNNCQHRGVEVAFDSGNRKTFMCPYHGWIYGLDGTLVDAPFMKESADFDKSKCRLPLVAVDTWGGFIFINLDPNAGDMKEDLGKYLSKMEYLRFEDCRIVDEMVIEADCNWKLIVENLMDAYHLGVLHSDTLGQDWDADKVNFELLDRGASYIVASNPTLTPNGKSLFGNMPWLKDVGDKFATSLTLPPNTVMFSRCDLLNTFHALPISAGRMRMTMYTLMPAQVLDDPELESKVAVYRDFTRAVFGEDGAMLLSLQHNFATEAYKPGPLNKLEEGIKHYLASIVDRVFEPEKLNA